ncbi:hypothetical protein ACWDUN_24690 [Mycobacterium sp. NPDC003323]
MTSRRPGFLAPLAVVLGIGAAVAGAGVAHADPGADTGGATTTSQSAGSSAADDPSATRPSPDDAKHDEKADDAPRDRTARTTADRDDTGPALQRRTEPRRAAAPSAGVRSGPQPSRSVATLEAPTTPEPPAAQPAAAPTTPSPADQAATPYGEIGKWMLRWGGQIANWGGKKYGGKTLLESVNVIIVDPNSSTRSQAGNRLNQAMFRSGFPAQPLHSFGFRGRIDDVTYGQRPKGLLLSYSNDFFLRQNDHGRIFGPDPIETETGFVWSGAFSTEKVGFTGWLPGHVYVSSNRARESLATALINSGQATFGGMVELDNAYHTATTTTGDHDGMAVVLVLTGIGGPPRREMLVNVPGEATSGPMSSSRSCSVVASAGLAPTQCRSDSAVVPIYARRS